MTLHLYGIATCDSCRRARRWLADAGLDCAYTDLRKDGIGASKIAGWVAELGLEAVLNKRSTTWRNLPAAAREIDSPAAAADLLAAHPTLIKRPVIELDDEVSVGFGPDVVARLERGAAS
jgi:Spx/MgsR family transcriptional regulator